MTLPALADMLVPRRQIPTRGLFDQLVDLLGEAIVGGRYAPGERLHIDQFCDGYGVSRTVMREALRVLQAKGLVTAKPNVGTLVRPTDQWNLLDADVLRWRRSTNCADQIDMDIAVLAMRLLGLHDELHGNTVFEQLLENVADIRCTLPTVSDTVRDEMPPTGQLAAPGSTSPDGRRSEIGGTYVTFDLARTTA